ncbi:ORF6C domain-containing protein [Exiguobacterium artemiae]
MVTSTFQMLADIDAKRKQSIQTIDSREIAEMTGKRHADLIRDVERYTEVMDQNADLRSDEFFIESEYQAGTGKNYKHYLVTRRGCDMIANKMTGDKGILFTATYVNRFHQMEQDEPPALTQTQLTARIAMQQAEQEQQLNELTEDVSYLKRSMRINTTEEYQIKKAGSTQVIKALGGRGSNAYEDKSIRSKAYAQFWSEFKRHFKMARYGDLAKRKLDDALEFIVEWAPDTELRLMIKHSNQQLTIEEVTR